MRKYQKSLTYGLLVAQKEGGEWGGKNIWRNDVCEHPQFGKIHKFIDSKSL